jgi:hypothetical protein
MNVKARALKLPRLRMKEHLLKVQAGGPAGAPGPVQCLRALQFAAAQARVWLDHLSVATWKRRRCLTSPSLTQLKSALF